MSNDSVTPLNSNLKPNGLPLRIKKNKIDE